MAFFADAASLYCSTTTTSESVCPPEDGTYSRVRVKTSATIGVEV